MGRRVRGMTAAVAPQRRPLLYRETFLKTVHTLALAVALALAPTLVAHAAPGDAAESVTLGGERRGEITSRSSLNHQDGSRSQLYRVDLREGQVASFKLEGTLRGKLTAYHGVDLVASSNPNSGAASLVVRARRAGARCLRCADA